MERCQWRRGGFWGISLLLIIIFLGAAGAWGQLVTKELEQPAEEKEERAKEPPKEIRLEELKYFPGILPPGPYGTLDVGPITGVLAPYGYPRAYDTLIRGWRGHQVGPVRVSPYLEYDGIYRSNIYETSFDKKADFLHVLNPGIRFEMPLSGRHKVSVGYLGNYFMYSRHDGNNHYDHNINADAIINLRGGLGLQFGNTFRSATEERTAPTGRQRDYYRETPYFVATYAVADKWKLQGSYQYDDLQFLKQIERINAYQEHTGGLTLYYKFWPKTAALVQYIVNSREYPFFPRGDNSSHSPLVGLTWDPTAKLSGTVKFGYTVKDYDQEAPGRNNSPESWAMSVQTLYHYSNYTTFSLMGQRSIQEDVDLINNNPYHNTGLYFAYNHNWHFLRSSLYMAFSFVNNNYLGPTTDLITGQVKRREDNIFSLGGGISRPFTPWLRLRLDYQYVNKNSNFSGFSYSEHKMLVGAQSSF